MLCMSSIGQINSDAFLLHSELKFNSQREKSNFDKLSSQR